MNIIAKASAKIIASLEAARARSASARARKQITQDRLDVVEHLNKTRGGDWYHKGDGWYADSMTGLELRVRTVPCDE